MNIYEVTDSFTYGGSAVLQKEVKKKIKFTRTYEIYIFTLFPFLDVSQNGVFKNKLINNF